MLVVTMTIIGILIYIIGIISVLVLDTCRKTLKFKNTRWHKTFKQNLLELLEGETSDDEVALLTVGCVLIPLGILFECIGMLIDLVDRTLLERLRNWCKNENDKESV